MNNHLLYEFLGTILSRWLVVFIVSIFISWLILRFLFGRNYGIVLPAANFIFVSVIALFVFVNREHDLAGLFWDVPFMFNMPTSFLFSSISIPISKMLPRSFLHHLITVPYISCLLLGSFQYYLIGRIIDSIILKFRKRN